MYHISFRVTQEKETIFACFSFLKDEKISRLLIGQTVEEPEPKKSLNLQYNQFDENANTELQ